MKAFITNFGNGWLCYGANRTTIDAFARMGITSSLVLDENPDAYFDDLIKQGLDKGLLDSRLVFPMLRWQEQRLVTTAEHLALVLELSAQDYRRLMYTVHRILRQMVDEMYYLMVIDDENGDIGRHSYTEVDENDTPLLVNAIFTPTYPLEGIQEEYGAGFFYIDHADDLWMAYRKAVNRKIEQKIALNDFDRNVLELT